MEKFGKGLSGGDSQHTFPHSAACSSPTSTINMEISLQVVGCGCHEQER